MTEFPTVYNQFFWPIKLNELIDYDTYQVRKFTTGCPNPKILADKIIRVIQYPFHAGKPDDLHILNTFHGKWCRRIELDFWQPASWTAAIGWGDCEDSSILFVAGCRFMGVIPDNVYEVFGYVRDPNTGEILGGHAWSYVRHECFGDSFFHYVESTLDVPPESYPPVSDIRRPFRWRDWELVPEIIWNDQHYETLFGESANSINLQARIASFIMKMRRTRYAEVDYLKLRFMEKETRRKYEAIRSMWRIQVKPLKKAGLLSKLRWRK